MDVALAQAGVMGHLLSFDAEQNNMVGDGLALGEVSEERADV